jgi:hypothetical protein
MKISAQGLTLGLVQSLSKLREIVTGKSVDVARESHFNPNQILSVMSSFHVNPENLARSL